MSDLVSEWLEQIGLGQYASVFAENEIDWDLLPDLDQDFLKAIGVNVVGHQMRILKAAKTLDAKSPDIATVGMLVPEVPGRSTKSADGKSSAERRQLTVMFCDLVGSTDLSGKLDPEVLRKVVRAYQKTAEEVIERFDGHIAQYLGDGLLVYFGYPVAHEDDAHRAVYAGIGIPQAIDALNVQLETDFSIRLSVRIGIHTGLVVVGEMGGNKRQENLAVGETPNLAARLQGLATPGSVVISESTRRLLGDLFALQSMGPQILKGVAEPVGSYLVDGERLSETRFTARQSDGHAEMVGRQQELALLIDRWRQAKAGEGQMVLLTGEAGIGKSRIASALIESLAPEEHLRITFQCSPYHIDTALYPATQQLIRAAGLKANDTADTKLDKLEALLRQGNGKLSVAVPLMGALLGLGEVAEARHGSLDYSPQQRLARTLDALVDQLTGLAEKSPVLFVLEDAHWIDPTTLELIDMTLDRIVSQPIMMLVTARPGFSHDFGGHPIVSRLALNRLGREAITGIVERVTRRKAFPLDLLEEIVAKTDGVPLFVEEFTKTLLESGQLRETDEGYRFDGRLDRLTIPSSLKDSLMARLDRMQPMKEVAQVAACIGREFGYSLLAAVSTLSPAELTSALDQLIAAELIFKRGVMPETVYTFKHALVRDAAYESMVREQRRANHAAIAAALGDADESDATVSHGLLAHHLQEAGEVVAAIDAWEAASIHSARLGASMETVAYCKHALTLLEGALVGRSGEERRLKILQVLSDGLMNTQGYAGAETQTCCQEIIALSHKLNESDEDHLIVLTTSAPVAFGTGQFRSHLQMYDALDRITIDNSSAPARIGTLLSIGVCNLHIGRLGRAVQYIESARNVGLSSPTQRLAISGGAIGHVPTCAYYARCLVYQGRFTGALATCDEALIIAIESDHLPTLCWAKQILGWTALFVDKADDAVRIADEYLPVAAEQGLQTRIATAQLVKGVALIQLREFSDGIRLARTGLHGWRQSGGKFHCSEYAAQIAGALLAHNKVEEAREFVDFGENIQQTTDECFCASELMRLRSDIMRHDGKPVEALRLLSEAIKLAKEHGMVLFSLRALADFLRYGTDLEHTAQMRIDLTALCDDLTSDKNFPDLIRAKAQLSADFR
ncbi:MAG: adenylate/guanylate cyclase domain-containing protein [Burkholderiaceae bacterium]